MQLSRSYTLMIIAMMVYVKANAQDRAQDSLIIAQSMEWLMQKMNYAYYNIDDNLWWVNKLSYDPVEQRVIIKNIATNKLGKSGAKTYLQRSFFLSDMNPYTLLVENQESNAGRIVAGEVLKLEVHQRKKLISQTKNGQRAPALSSVYFSIPQYMIDTVTDFSEEAKKKWFSAIERSTRVYKDESFSEDGQSFLELLEGTFEVNEEIWTINKIFNNTLQVIVNHEEQKVRKTAYLRKSTHSDHYEWVWISPESPTRVIMLHFEKTPYFELTDAKRETLIQIINKNSISIKMENQTIELIKR